MATYFDSRKLSSWLKGDKSAIDFIETMMDVAHLWDDLIDKDKAVSDEEINKLFFTVLISLPRNSFYRKHFDHLNSVLINSMANWMVATKMERDGGDYETSIAFILRSSYVDLVTQAALLIGGQKWACKVGEEVRLLTHDETYKGYLSNLTKEKQGRALNELNASKESAP